MIHSEQRRETLKLLSDFYYVKDSKVLPDSNICPCKHFPNLKFFVLASPELFFFPLMKLKRNILILTRRTVKEFFCSVKSFG